MFQSISIVALCFITMPLQKITDKKSFKILSNGDVDLYVDNVNFISLPAEVYKVLKEAYNDAQKRWQRKESFQKVLMNINNVEYVFSGCFKIFANDNSAYIFCLRKTENGVSKSFNMKWESLEKLLEKEPIIDRVKISNLISIVRVYFLLLSTEMKALQKIISKNKKVNLSENQRQLRSVVISAFKSVKEKTWLFDDSTGEYHVNKIFDEHEFFANEILANDVERYKNNVFSKSINSLITSKCDACKNEFEEDTV